MAKICIAFFLLTLSFSGSITAVISTKDLDPKVCQDIWTAAGNNLKVPLELKVDLTDGTSQVFTLEPAGAEKIDSSPVFQSFRALLQMNNQANQDQFLDSITQPGGPVNIAWEYLKEKGILNPAEDRATFINYLWKIWFQPPADAPTRQGFRHVFIGEEGKKNKYSGFHNWYQLYLEQLKGPNTIKDVTFKLNSYTYNTEPSFMSLNFVWKGLTKNDMSSMFVGTSPAFDFAMFSLCSIVLFKENHLKKGVPQEKDCTCKIHKSRVTIKAINRTKKKQILSKKICTAFPTSVVSDFVCTSVPPTKRTDCGWLGIDHHNCAERGCCFDSQQYGGHIYWCFYPADHQCHGIPHQNRKDCGFPGISRNECEGKGCCFDENFGHGVPHCFEGVPKG